jgi:hypothetical protein
MSQNNLPAEVWKTWKEFNQAIKGKDIIFFGVSDDWTTKTMRKSAIDSFTFVDNSNAWAGQVFMGAEIAKPEKLQEANENRYVVITSGAYESIIPQLLEYGLRPGQDFCITPAMNNLRIISDIHNHEAQLLISSPDHAIYSQLDKTNNDVGGGLFKYDISTFSYDRVVEGTFHQIVEFEDGFYIADEKRGICQIGKDLELKDVFGHVDGAKPHGIAYCPERKLLFLAETGHDRISVYDATSKKHLSNICLTDKISKTGKPGHWINDLFVKDNYLYASMFSHTGSYLEGVYDGGVLQINIDKPEDRNVLIRDLWMPHSVCFFDSELCILDSMRGNFLRTDKDIIGEFYGFVRGLAFDGKYYYVGQSETRYFDRLKGIKKNIGMSAGFYLFDDESKAAKFYTMPTLHQVRDIVPL